ncbi:hypothetical protein QJS10_CPA06g02069 [Acorus calamus]|uniref:Uncharacterized protein n=1 Tax=Acorus calamus TaxID=4465 RepID=A0AAV9EKK6_ACOCL|nr:hypothetical protein QJS10_CPA06g02069 [Acorus calamus]
MRPIGSTFTGEDLSERFLEGNNFMPWFRKRREAAEQEQHRLWRQARVVADIKTFISKMSELEVVDSFNAIQRHLLAEMQKTTKDWKSTPRVS